MRETLLAVDGNSLMHRAFHALPLMDTNGIYTNAVHGFLSMLLKAAQDLSPRYIAVAFDLPVPTFRHTAYADYKAGRRAMPEEMRPQFPLIKEILGDMKLGVLTAEEQRRLLETLERIDAEEARLLAGDGEAELYFKARGRRAFGDMQRWFYRGDDDWELQLFAKRLHGVDAK